MLRFFLIAVVETASELLRLRSADRGWKCLTVETFRVDSKNYPLFLASSNLAGFSRFVDSAVQDREATAMGIKGLTTYVEERRLGIKHTLEDSTFPAVFVVDASAFMFGLKSCVTIRGGDYWETQTSFRTIITCWREFGITPIFVFDGQSRFEYPRAVTDALCDCFRSMRSIENEDNSLANEVVDPVSPQDDERIERREARSCAKS